MQTSLDTRRSDRTGKEAETNCAGRFDPEPHLPWDLKPMKGFVGGATQVKVYGQVSDDLSWFILEARFQLLFTTRIVVTRRGSSLRKQVSDVSQPCLDTLAFPKGKMTIWRQGEEK